MTQEDSKYCVAYKLHKDKSPILQGCDTEAEQVKWVKELKADKYDPIPMSMEDGVKWLMREGKKFEPKPVKKTAQDRWWDWAIGK